MAYMKSNCKQNTKVKE